MKRFTGVCAIAALTIATVYILVDARAGSDTSQRDQSAAPALTKVSTRASDNRPTLPRVHRAGPALLPADDRAADDVTELSLSTEEERRDQLDRILANDGTTTWSSTAAQIIGQRMPDLLPAGSQLLRVECGTEFCRIQTTHGNVDEFRQFVDQAFLMPEGRLWNGGFFASIVDGPDSSDGVEAIAYLAKDGIPLPTPGS